MNFKFPLTSENKVFYISKILPENCSSCSMFKIFQKYLNFENISKIKYLNFGRIFTKVVKSKLDIMPLKVGVS